MDWSLKNFSKIDDKTSEHLQIDGFIHNTKDTPTIHIDGFILPRLSSSDQYKEYPQKELIRMLFLKYKENFIQHIKGIFIIIIIEGNCFKIFNDRHGIKKYFIFKREDHFLISNSLKTISEQVNCTLDRENIALFSLLSHHVNGNTIYKDISTCQPAQRISYNGKALNQCFYWHPSKLIVRTPLKRIPVTSYATKWETLFKNSIDYLKPTGISLTLTGGNDSRMCLAALLSLKKKFNTFTYGNPASYDAVISDQISKKIKAGHCNYFVSNPSKKWFQDQANRLIIIGNSLINIHRAHRNDAAESEKTHRPANEMIITGLVGGEYFKEPFYGKVIPFLLKQFQHKKANINLLESELKNHGIKSGKIDINKVHEKLLDFIDHGKGFTDKQRKFIYTYLYYGCAHHAQDTNVFHSHFKYVLNPFMDIDFLEFMSEDKKWYLNKKINKLNRLFHSSLLVGVTNYLAPELSMIPYAKKGAYTATDLLNNKVRYLLKRISYIIQKDKDNYPPNFPMGSWLNNYCEHELEDLPEELKSLFDLNYLKENLELIRDKKTEASWHVITNPINVKLSYEVFGKKV